MYFSFCHVCNRNFLFQRSIEAFFPLEKNILFSSNRLPSMGGPHAQGMTMRSCIFLVKAIFIIKFLSSVLKLTHSLNPYQELGKLHYIMQRKDLPQLWEFTWELSDPSHLATQGPLSDSFLPIFSPSHSWSPHLSVLQGKCTEWVLNVTRWWYKQMLKFNVNTEF